ncbi:hypothetical protein BB987_18950 [Photorhabdus temperata]|nr:hypothetical protein BB987_18950 [Photorhabdus temperata]
MKAVVSCSNKWHHIFYHLKASSLSEAVKLASQNMRGVVCQLKFSVYFCCLSLEINMIITQGLCQVGRIKYQNIKPIY